MFIHSANLKRQQKLAHAFFWIGTNGGIPLLGFGHVSPSAEGNRDAHYQMQYSLAYLIMGRCFATVSHVSPFRAWEANQA